MPAAALAEHAPAKCPALGGALSRLSAVQVLIAASPERHIAYARHPLNEAVGALYRIAAISPGFRMLPADLPLANILSILRDLRTELEVAVLQQPSSAFVHDLVATLHGVGRAITYVVVALRLEAIGE